MSIESQSVNIIKTGTPGVVLLVDEDTSQEGLFDNLDPNTTKTVVVENGINPDGAEKHHKEVPLIRRFSVSPWMELGGRGWLDVEVHDISEPMEMFLTLKSTDWFNNELGFSLILGRNSPLTILPRSNPAHVQSISDGPPNSTSQFPQTYLARDAYIDWRREGSTHQIRIRRPDYM